MSASGKATPWEIQFVAGSLVFWAAKAAELGGWFARGVVRVFRGVSLETPEKVLAELTRRAFAAGLLQ